MKKEPSKKEPILYYNFDCGCTVPKKDVIFPTYTHKATCPKHKDAQMISRETTCIDCGRPIVKISATGRVPKRCLACTTEHNYIAALQRNKARYHELKKSNVAKLTSMDKVPERRHDCKYYNDCLAPLTGRLMKNPSACKNCQHYVFKPLDVMDYTYKNDYNEFWECETNYE